MRSNGTGAANAGMSVRSLGSLHVVPVRRPVLEEAS